MTTTQKLIIAHDLLGDISDNDIREALGTDPEKENWPIIRFPQSHKMELGKTINLGWMNLKARQEDYFNSTIKTAIPSKDDLQGADFELIYFGLAPVSLAIHLGFLIPSFVKVKVFQRHHIELNWKWTGLTTPEPELSDLPSFQIQKSGDIVLRISTTHAVTDELTKKMVVEPLMAIDLKSPALGLDVFGDEDGLENYSRKMQQVFHSITTYLPKADAIHIFASIPAGFAFLIGARINPNTQTLIYTYEYSSTRVPPYKMAFTLQSKPRRHFEFGEDDKDRIQFRRNFFEYHLGETKKALSKINKSSEEPNWFRHLFSRSEINDCLFDSSIWNSLSPITETNFESSHFVYVPHNILHNDETSMTLLKNTWYLPNNFVHSLEETFENRENDMAVAIELLWFQEILKSETHDVHSDNAHELARYPMILQEIDYQSDVYSLLNLYKRYNVHSDKASAFFLKMIELHLKSMWSSDLLDHSDEMELRRVNRYLIWYYHLNMIREKTLSLEDILELLSKKPLIELRLVGVTTPDQSKITIEFRQSDESELAIAAFHKNRIITSRQQLSMNQLIEGFKNKDIAAIDSIMNQFVRDLN